MDHNKRSTILKNTAFVESDIKLFMSDVLRFLPQAKIPYDIIYADPPFPMKNKLRIANLVERHGLLAPSALFIIHYPAEEREQWPDSIGSLQYIDERKYGRSLLRFYKEHSTHAD
jgi:16S rRNA G966 N2-methylase RsmD